MIVDLSPSLHLTLLHFFNSFTLSDLPHCLQSLDGGLS